jgi:hypothetical protein
MLPNAMTFRDNEAVLRERIDRLELSLAKAAGRSMLLEDEREELRAELERLTNDPTALARVRKSNARRSTLFGAMRVFGIVAVLFAVLPMFVFAFFMFFGSDPGAGILCATIPTFITLGVILLKTPEIMNAMELSAQKRRQAQKAAQRVRVEVPPVPAAQEHPVEIEASKRAQR